MTMNKIAFVYLGVDICLIALSLVLGGTWLLNTQIAFICSVLIVFASFISYKNLVQKRLEDGDVGEERDLLDKIGDEHELFEDEQEGQECLNHEDFKEIYKEERVKAKGVKQSFKNLLQSWSGALGLYRLAAYFILFLAIMVLIRKGFFHPIAFIVGISALPLATLISSFLSRNER